MRGHAFISYVREDGQVVDRLQGALESAGIPVWRDTTDLYPGQDWRTEIRRAIADARVFIVCFSERSLGRETPLFREELAWAVEQYRLRPPDPPWLIPIRLTDSPLPRIDLGAGRTLESLNWLNLFGDRWDDAVASLVGGIRRLPPLEDSDKAGLPKGSQAALANANPGNRSTTVGSLKAPENVPIGGITESGGRYLGSGSPAEPREVPSQGGPSRPNVEFLPVNLPPRLDARFRFVAQGSPYDYATTLVVDDAESGDRRVLKLYPPRVTLSREFAATLQALSQDDEAARHLVALYEFGTEGGVWYVVQEYSPHGSLPKALAAGRRIDPVELAGEVTAALEYLEGRLFHHDLTPESFLVRSLEPLDVVVGDFDLDRDSGSGSVRWSERGTFAYRPPEVAWNRVTNAWDWWSAGMVIAEVALGRHPLMGPEGVMPPLPQIVERVQEPVDLSGIADERLRNLCQGLLFPDPDRRWRSQQVAAWLAGEDPDVPWAEPAGEIDRLGPNDALPETERRSVRDERVSSDRVVEVVAYLGTNDPDRADVIIDRIDDLFLAAGGVRLTIASVERGSFFVKLRGLLSGDVAQREFRDRLAKLERGVELRLLDGHQADVTDKTAKAFAAVKAELADVEVACIRIESLLVLKYPNAHRSVLLVRTLSHLEVRALERYPELQQHPERLLEALSSVVAMEVPSTEGLRPTASDD